MNRIAKITWPARICVTLFWFAVVSDIVPGFAALIDAEVWRTNHAADPLLAAFADGVMLCVLAALLVSCLRPNASQHTARRIWLGRLGWCGRILTLVFWIGAQSHYFASGVLTDTEVGLTNTVADPMLAAFASGLLLAVLCGALKDGYIRLVVTKKARTSASRAEPAPGFADTHTETARDGATRIGTSLVEAAAPIPSSPLRHQPSADSPRPIASHETTLQSEPWETDGPVVATEVEDGITIRPAPVTTDHLSNGEFCADTDDDIAGQIAPPPVPEEAGEIAAELIPADTPDDVAETVEESTIRVSTITPVAEIPSEAVQEIHNEALPHAEEAVAEPEMPAKDVLLAEDIPAHTDHPVQDADILTEILDEADAVNTEDVATTQAPDDATAADVLPEDKVTEALSDVQAQVPAADTEPLPPVDQESALADSAIDDDLLDDGLAEAEISVDIEPEDATAPHTDILPGAADAEGGLLPMAETAQEEPAADIMVPEETLTARAEDVLTADEQTASEDLTALTASDEEESTPVPLLSADAAADTPPLPSAKAIGAEEDPGQLCATEEVEADDAQLTALFDSSEDEAPALTIEDDTPPPQTSVDEDRPPADVAEEQAEPAAAVILPFVLAVSDTPVESADAEDETTDIVLPVSPEDDTEPVVLADETADGTQDNVIDLVLRGHIAESVTESLPPVTSEPETVQVQELPLARFEYWDRQNSFKTWQVAWLWHDWEPNEKDPVGTPTAARYLWLEEHLDSGKITGVERLADGWKNADIPRQSLIDYVVACGHRPKFLFPEERSWLASRLRTWQSRDVSLAELSSYMTYSDVKLTLYKILRIINSDAVAAEVKSAMRRGLCEGVARRVSGHITYGYERIPRHAWRRLNIDWLGNVSGGGQSYCGLMVKFRDGYLENPSAPEQTSSAIEAYGEIDRYLRDPQQQDTPDQDGDEPPQDPHLQSPDRSAGGRG